MRRRLPLILSYGPTQLLDLLLSGVGITAEQAMLFVFVVASSRRRDVQYWAEALANYDMSIQSRSVEEIRAIAGGMLSAIDLTLKYERLKQHNKCCIKCIQPLLYHYVAALIFSIARLYGLMPLIEEGSYRAYYYLILALGEATLEKAKEALMAEIDMECRKRGCRINKL